MSSRLSWLQFNQSISQSVNQSWSKGNSEALLEYHKNTLLQVKVLQKKCYLSKSIKIELLKLIGNTKSKSTN